MSVDRPKPDLLTLADWERLHHTLGVIGDEARPARPYIDLRTLEVPIRTFAAPRPVGRRVFVGVAAITSLAIGVLAWRLNDSHTTVVTAIDPTDQPDSASPANSPTTDPTAVVTTPVVSTATVPAPAPSTPVSPLSLGFEGPWYNVGLDGAESAGPTIGQADLLGGESTTIWIGGNSAGPAPVVVLFRTAVGGAYRNRLRGSEEHPSGVDPDAALVSDPTDQPDPDHPQLVGNELRWKRKDGVVLQFTSFGLSPSALELAVSLIQDPPAQTCFPSCTLPTFNLVGTFGQTALDGGNGLQVVTEDIRWADSTLRLERYQGAGFENVAEWTSEEVRQIDFDQSALIVDGTVALWDRDGYRFKLSGIPEGQLDTALGELRVTGAPMTLGEGWNRLSDPPLSPRSNAVAAWTGNELILSGGDTVDCATGGDCAPGERFVDRSSASSTDMPVRVTSYAPGRAVPLTVADAPGPTGIFPLALGSEVFLSPGGSGLGGQGGVYDLETHSWSSLPPAPVDPAWDNYPVGYVDQTDANYGWSSGWVLDRTYDVWELIPDRDGRYEAAIATMGRNLVSFGGFDSATGAAHNDVSIWVPPSNLPAD